MSDDAAYREKGKFKKGHPGSNQHTNPPPPSPEPPADGEFDAAILAAANDFGTTKKPKTGLPGYCASLRDSRPQDFAILVTKALARRTAAHDNATAYAPITVGFTTCPSNFFVPFDEAQALWAAKTSERPVLVIDNSDTPPIDDDTPSEDDDDNA